MNKTTIKISVLAFLGFMTYGYAQQQQQDPHRGKVGVNTIEPSATMDIRPSTANAQKEATTNEGIIAPKLSKTRIANIATPVEGTLVYATDDATSLISAYTGNDPKVAKITEKGYYFYNGTEWVKAGNNSLAVDGSKWTNDTANNVVKLTNLSDGTTPRTDDKNIFINDDGYLGIGVRPIDRALTIVGDTYEKASVKIRRAYSSVNASPTIEFEKARGNNANLEAVKRNESLGNIAYRGYDGSNFLSGAAIVAKAEKDAEVGKIPTKFLFNLRGENDTDPVTKMVLTSEGKLGLDTGNHVPNIQFAIKNTYTGLDYIENEGLFLVSKGTSALNTGVRSIGSVEISSDTNSNFASSNNRFEGINFNVSGQERMRISEAGNVGIGTITPSEKLEVNGSIKSSALAGTGNRPVYADAQGKLVIGSSTTIRAAWVPDTASNSVQLAITSANGDRTTHPISITDEGMVRATSFQGVNGATIFPDYVFQKYYTGTSSIKADYHFKSLSQVEDFVKTNGHLPGYKSAETIKAQGYVDLMETQLTNVEKIEELYLHSIEQDKALKAKESKIQELEAKNRLLESRLERLEKLIQ